MVKSSTIHASASGQGAHLVPTVGLALPLVFVRLLYQILTVFIHQGDFVGTNGPILVLVFMSAIEEFLVIFIFLLVGLRLDKLENPNKGRSCHDRGKTGTEDSGVKRRRGHRGSRGWPEEEYQGGQNVFIDENNPRQHDGYHTGG